MQGLSLEWKIRILILGKIEIIVKTGIIGESEISEKIEILTNLENLNNRLNFSADCWKGVYIFFSDK